MRIDDPSATYRGYRRQALYCLFRLFDYGLPQGCVIQPEGNEDLAVFDSTGKLIEIVQVKDHSDNLTVSSFKPSFYKRIAPFCATGSTTIVRLASYGPIGPDLQKAKSGDASAQKSVLKTLTKYLAQNQVVAEDISGKVSRLAVDDARNIIRHIQLTPVGEEMLTNVIVAKLAKTITSVNAVQAFEILMWWLLSSSETQLLIDRGKAIAKIEHIGRFLSQRAAYCDEWHTSIMPIVPSKGETVDTGSVAEEFYRGGKVRFDHVHLNLDYPRKTFLKKIHDAFNENNVVIVHSASGQGKSTLAYRYAKDFAASDFRLEVLSSADLKHARRLALALTGHSEVVDIPTLILLDVRPGDNFWVEVIRGLSSVAGIRVLVLIREEDFARSRICAADFSFADVQLSFEKHEAEVIYNLLTERMASSRHLDFEDAWNQFGARKTLFEFVYFITQEETLAARISAQVRALQDAVIRGERSKGELDLLMLVSVASAYEARLDLKELLAQCELAAPLRTIELFDNEYLIRVSDDGSAIEGYHAVRSEIILSKLTDAIACPWSDAAVRILPVIIEEDLQNFLLCAFSRHPQSSKFLIVALNELQPKSWVGIHAVATSLLWNGIREYSEQNSSLLDEVFQKTNSGWYLTLDWDLGQVFGGEGFKFFEKFEELLPEKAEAADYARSVVSRQSDKNAVFSNSRIWMEGLTGLPLIPDDVRNFCAMGEVLFWLGHMKIDTVLRSAIDVGVMDKANEKLPIYLFGEFVRGIRSCAKEVYFEWLASRREDFMNHLRQTAAIVKLDEADDSVIVHYVIDLDQQSSVLRSRDDSSNATQATVHDLSIERLTLLSNLFADKERYGAVGYGHRKSFFTKLWDDADKPGVLSEYLPANWLPRFNATAKGYAEHRYRPLDWAEYFEKLQLLRESVLSALGDLRTVLRRFQTFPELTGSPLFERPSEWEECRQEINKQLFLPRASVDEWGFITESSNSDVAISRLERYSSLDRFAPVRQAVDEYARTVANFMSQCPACLIMVPLLNGANSQFERDRLMVVASEQGFSEHSIRLSVVNLFDAVAAIEKMRWSHSTAFGNLRQSVADSKFFERELKEFGLTLIEWCSFVDSDTRKQMVEKSARKSRSRLVKSTDAVEVSDLLFRTKRRVKNSLLALRAKGIKAKLLSERILWKGKPALWITCDTSHPIAGLHAVETLWHQLVAAFSPDREKVVRLKAFELLWPTIVVVPVVAGKAFERVGFTHFQGVSYIDPPDLEQHPWQLSPESIPEDVWLQLGLEQWNVQQSLAVFDRFAAAYGLLLHHVEHMADFCRLPSELDELGFSILQSYFNHEEARAQPLVQEVFDSCSVLYEKFSDFGDQEFISRPNSFWCLKNLVEVSKAILPTSDACGHFKLSIEQVGDWRDRLVAGLQLVGVARCLWIADSLSFSAPPDTSFDT